jgi:endoglucanase
MNKLDAKLSKLFQQLTSTPSLSGFESLVQQILKQFLEPYADDCWLDVQGNLIAYKKGKTDKNLMLIAHSDEIGLMVKYIDEGGFIRFAKIGGVDVSALQGLKVAVYHNGERIQGVIGKKPIHMKTAADREISKPVDIGELWIDIGATSKKDAEKMVSVGDIITFEPSFNALSNNLITCKSADDKVGLLIMAAVLQNLAQYQIDASLYIVSSVQEEIGLRGAITATYNIQPDVCIAIDVTHATDYPTVSKNLQGDIKLNSGVVIPLGANVNNQLQAQLKQLAIVQDISYQIEANAVRSGTDANAAQISRGGVITGLVCVPCRYMHSPIEIVSKNDICSAINLLTEFCKTTKWEILATPFKSKCARRGIEKRYE